mgnify:CR=1 FL=1
MVRHVILWKLKEMPAAEQETVKADIKAGLEGLAGQIPGLTEIHVYTKALPSSANADLMLDTTFVDDLGADSLDVFQIIMGLEEEFDIEIPNEQAEKIVTVGDAVEQIKAAMNEN